MYRRQRASSEKVCRAYQVIIADGSSSGRYSRGARLAINPCFLQQRALSRACAEFPPCVQKLLVQNGVVHKEYNTHMVLHSLHIPNSQLYVSEPPPEWFGNGPNEVRS